MQGRFVSGRYTQPVLSVLAILMWFVGFYLLPATQVTEWNGIGMEAVSPLLASGISLLCYVAVAFMLASLHLIEQRIHWLPALYMWIVALALFVHGNVLWAVSAMLFMLLKVMLFVCHPIQGVESSLFAAFAILGVGSLVFPQFLLILPLGIVYMFVVNIMSPKRFMAAMLGLVTPFWLVAGAAYVYPSAVILLSPFFAGAESLLQFRIAEPLPMRLLLTFIELLIMLPAIAVFVSMHVPSKPILRRRMAFVILTNVYLLLLSWLSVDNFELFFTWRISGIAIMTSYVFLLKISKVSNVYFVFINILWFAVAAFSLWQS